MKIIKIIYSNDLTFIYFKKIYMKTSNANIGRGKEINIVY